MSNFISISKTAYYYFGVGNIISKHLSIERLKNISPNFIVIMDSHILRPNTRPKQKVSRIKKDFEKEGHKFWLIDQYYEIEGFIPQKVIEDFFQLKNIPKREKNPYEPLNKYITFLRNNKEIDDGSPNYNKVDHAPLISKLILSNPNYVREIRQNNYIAKNVKEIIDTIDLWNNRLPSSRIIENHPIDDWSGISIIPPSESRKILGTIKKIVPENDMDDHELFQISKFVNEFTIKQSKMQIIDFFNHYEKEGKDYKDQRMVLIYFNDLLDENKINLKNIGFVYIRNRNTVQDENFAISIKKNKNDQFDRFLIRKLKKGKKLEPDKVYYSTGFSKKDRNLSENSVLDDFIKYLKYNEF